MKYQPTTLYMDRCHCSMGINTFYTFEFDWSDSSSSPTITIPVQLSSVHHGFFSIGFCFGSCSSFVRSVFAVTVRVLLLCCVVYASCVVSFLFFLLDVFHIQLAIYSDVSPHPGIWHTLMFVHTFTLLPTSTVPPHYTLTHHPFNFLYIIFFLLPLFFSLFPFSLFIVNFFVSFVYFLIFAKWMEFLMRFSTEMVLKTSSSTGF